MVFNATPLAGVYVIDLTPFQDDRGWFARTYCKNEFASIGHTKEFVQMNHSFTRQKGALRGMHYQLPPYGEIKLVRCIAGKVFDAVIDVRKYSPTFLQWFGTELSAENKRMMYIPEGFAHGFQALTENCEMSYNASAFYTPGVEGGIKYNDPAVNIQWPLPLTDISDKDQKLEFINSSFKGI